MQRRILPKPVSQRTSRVPAAVLQRGVARPIARPGGGSRHRRRWQVDARSVCTRRSSVWARPTSATSRSFVTSPRDIRTATCELLSARSPTMGHSAEPVPEAGGCGIVNMNARARQLGASLEGGHTEVGTRVLSQVPCRLQLIGRRAFGLASIRHSPATTLCLESTLAFRRHATFQGPTPMHIDAFATPTGRCWP